MSQLQRNALSRIKELCRARDAATGIPTYDPLARFVERELEQDHGFFAFKIIQTFQEGELPACKAYLEQIQNRYKSLEATRQANASRHERDQETAFILESSIVSDIHKLKAIRGLAYTAKLLTSAMS